MRVSLRSPMEKTLVTLGYIRACGCLPSKGGNGHQGEDTVKHVELFKETICYKMVASMLLCLSGRSADVLMMLQ